MHLSTLRQRLYFLLRWNSPSCPTVAMNHNCKMILIHSLRNLYQNPRQMSPRVPRIASSRWEACRSMPLGSVRRWQIVVLKSPTRDNATTSDLRLQATVRLAKITIRPAASIYVESCVETFVPGRAAAKTGGRCRCLVGIGLNDVVDPVLILHTVAVLPIHKLRVTGDIAAVHDGTEVVTAFTLKDLEVERALGPCSGQCYVI